MHRVLLVDDEQEILNDRSKLIMDLGYECLVALNGKAAIELARDSKPDIVLTDMKMADWDGFYLLKAMKQLDPSIPVVLFTGYGTIESAVQAMKLGAYDYVEKPISIELMQVVLQNAIEYPGSYPGDDLLAGSMDDMNVLENVTGKSQVMLDVAKRVIKVSKTDANVLIFGESGTGKEWIARNIHLHSHRSNKPFIPLDCVALPDTLLESEIFGFEKGGFTGATRSKPGMMELADGGTLFLDEIVELDLNLQAKLLRALQERQFRRVGGTELINVDIRIISATNKNPEHAVKKGMMRPDLYYRLNVIPIVLPPLRERKEDIPVLVQHFMNQFNPSCPNLIKGISCEALNCLKRYDWPGNVRELQNVIEQAMSMTNQDRISLNDLPNYLIENNISYIEESDSELPFKEAKENFLSHFRKQYFEYLLKKYNGNISKIARKAGVSRKTIYKYVKKSNV